MNGIPHSACPGIWEWDPWTAEKGICVKAAELHSLWSLPCASSREGNVSKGETQLILSRCAAAGLCVDLGWEQHCSHTHGSAGAEQGLHRAWGWAASLCPTLRRGAQLTPAIPGDISESGNHAQLAGKSSGTGGHCSVSAELLAHSHHLFFLGFLSLPPFFSSLPLPLFFVLFFFLIFHHYFLFSFSY